MKTFSIAAKMPVNIIIKAKNKKEALMLAENAEEWDYQIIDFAKMEIIGNLKNDKIIEI